jgi:hypothetical protein
MEPQVAALADLFAKTLSPQRVRPRNASRIGPPPSGAAAR